MDCDFIVGLNSVSNCMSNVCVSIDGQRFEMLQCSKLFHSKVSSGFLQQDSQRSYSFGNT